MWDGAQRQRLLDLAADAGLPVSDHTLIDEPVAAGVRGLERQRGLGREVQGKLLVVDMGGGTLDVALLDVSAELGHDPEISVLSSWGIDEAGDALDEAIALDLEQELRDWYIDPTQVSPGVAMASAREAKLQLSDALDTVVAPRDPRLSLPPLRYSRERLEVAFDPQLARAERLIWSVLRGADVTHETQRSPSEIRRLSPKTLAGEGRFRPSRRRHGSGPGRRRSVERIFPGVDLYTDAGVPPDESIAVGLGETIAYDRVNLHRPPFSFVLEYAVAGQKHTVPVYNAYDPSTPPVRDAGRHPDHEWSMTPATHHVPGTATCASTPPGDGPCTCSSRTRSSRVRSGSSSGTDRR